MQGCSWLKACSLSVHVSSIRISCSLASTSASSIVAKKWEPGILVPSRFSAQNRKVEARLGKLAKIRKVETG